MKRREIPKDLRARFIQLLRVSRNETPAVSEDILWEVSARLLHAELMNEWEHFKDDIGIYASEDILGEMDEDNPYSGNYGGAL